MRPCCPNAFDRFQPVHARHAQIHQYDIWLFFANDVECCRSIAGITDQHKALSGSLVFPLSLGTLICLAQLLAGVSLSLLLFGPTVLWTIVALALLGLFSAPLAVWAQ